MPYPAPIQDYLLQHIVACRQPGYLYVSPDSQVLEAGGALAHYGLHAVKRGQWLEDRVCFLQGLLPLDGEPVEIPLLQFDTKQYADLHLVPGEAGDWVLLLDSTEEALRQQRAQQIVYHLKWTHDLQPSSGQ